MSSFLPSPALDASTGYVQKRFENFMFHRTSALKPASSTASMMRPSVAMLMPSP